jgi:hypothetical protein
MVGLILLSFQQHTNYEKEDKTTHYLKTVGICKQPANIKIYDETGGTNFFRFLDGASDYYTTEPANTIENKHFQKYVNTISKYVFGKVESMGWCQGNRDKPQVELVFVYRSAISRGIAPFNFQPQRSHNTRYLDSPWVKLTLDKSPKTILRGVFIWNERQFLLDHRSMLERRVLDTKPLLPIDIQTFERWEKTDEQETLSGRANFVKKLPADMQWLFTYGTIADCDPPLTRASKCGLDTIAKAEKVGYTDLTKALIEQFFTSPKTNIRYDSVFDLKSVFNIEKYQIKKYY